MLIKISLIHWLSRYLLIHVLSTSQILGKIASNKIKFLPSWGLHFRRRRWMTNIKWMCIYIYMSTQFSNSSHPPPSATWCPYICSLCLCLYFCFVNMFICTVFFLDCYVCMLIYDTYFSLSDLLHCIWQSLGPSTSLQVVKIIESESTLFGARSQAVWGGVGVERGNGELAFSGDTVSV